MKRILLVTAREYRRMVALPEFWIVSLIVPVLVLLAPFAGSLGKSKTAGYVLVDKSGRYAGQVRRRLELDYQRQVLVQLLVYAANGAWAAAQSPIFRHRLKRKPRRAMQWLRNSSRQAEHPQFGRS